ncbi:hypothetical protein C8J56DRAFT_881957 [Mycena floridula]|nr:hypothetical protein C8J56DRAFT_881957 [Mycena floridula]
MKVRRPRYTAYMLAGNTPHYRHSPKSHLLQGGPINDKHLKADLVAIATELSLAISTAKANKALAALIQAHIDANPDYPRILPLISYRSPIQPKGLGHRGKSSGDKAAEDLHQDTAGPVEVTGAHKKLLDHEIPVDPLPSFVQLTTKLGTSNNLSVQDEGNGSECGSFCRWYQGGIEPGANLLDNSESLLLPVPQLVPSEEETVEGKGKNVFVKESRQLAMPRCYYLWNVALAGPSNRHTLAEASNGDFVCDLLWQPTATTTPVGVADITQISTTGTSPIPRIAVKSPSSEPIQETPNMALDVSDINPALSKTSFGGSAPPPPPPPSSGQSVQLPENGFHQCICDTLQWDEADMPHGKAVLAIHALARFNYLIYGVSC